MVEGYKVLDLLPFDAGSSSVDLTYSTPAALPAAQQLVAVLSLYLLKNTNNAQLQMRD